jgi:primosomal protein N' (replication factor Y)
VGAHRSRRGAQEGGGGAGLIVRVQPDVPAIHRAFDYSLPPDLAVEIGTLVRVPLHGRRVRGWVVDADVAEPEASDLRDVLAVVSAGPPADVVDLCRWAAWRWAGPLATFLRAASPPNVVPADLVVEQEEAVYPGAPLTGAELHVVGPRDELRAPLAPEGSTLVLDPSPGRVARLSALLRDQGRDVVPLGSEHPDAVRTRAWDRARAGACVVVGGRSAVWAPVPDLAAVVVFDEGDEALEDERAPTWNGRDVAVERVRRAGAALRVVTPAPTVDALVAVGAPSPSTGRWAPVAVVDQRDEEPGHGLLSAALADALRHTTGRGERAVCLLNRRGRARLLACRTCRELARCETCGATVEQRDDGFACARCGTERPTVCLHCHGSTFRAVRPGITRVRDDLAALLPRTEVAAVDATTDTVPDVPVMVGTEAVLHRVPAPVGLVSYLELDQELLAPRARASEQALWLLVRGTRLLGDGGRLLVQTRLPEHEVVRAVRRSAPMLVADAERQRRQALGFPPFGGLAEVSGAPDAVGAACAAAGAAGVTVLGPVVDGTRALLRALSRDALCDALATPGVDAARSRGRLRIDVDPRRV